MRKSSSKSDEILHDIKSPLTSAIISCECLLDLKNRNLNFDSQNVLENLSDIHESLGYIKELVSVAPVGKNKNEEFGVNDAISSVCGNFKKNNFIYRFGNEHFLHGNKLKFKRVICNLFKNSIEAGGKDVWIIVAVKMVDSGRSKESVVIEIKDNGPGIPQGILKDVFKNGFSTKGELNNNCGLGLYICKSIIEKDFGGKITVKSNVGENHGTIFTIRVAPKKQG